MTRTTPSIVGLNLRRLRLARGLSQEALAQLGGWSRVYIARIETGAVQSPTAKTIQKLAELLGVSIEELLSPRAGESPIGPLVDQFLESPWAEVIQPTEEEIEWLRGLNSIFWVDLPPTPVTLLHLIKARRGQI